METKPLGKVRVTKPIADTSTVQLKQNTSECSANLADSLTLTSHACKDLSQKRRDMHRPHILPERAGICAPHVPMPAEWLYPKGSEFRKSLKEQVSNLVFYALSTIAVISGQSLKEARETQKLGQDIWGQASRRGQSQQWHSGNSSAGAFLGHQHWNQGGRQLQQQETLEPGQEGCQRTYKQLHLTG